jgi:hypothetical protein
MVSATPIAGEVRTALVSAGLVTAYTLRHLVSAHTLLPRCPVAVIASLHQFTTSNATGDSISPNGFHFALLEQRVQLWHYMLCLLRQCSVCPSPPMILPLSSPRLAHYILLSGLTLGHPR